MCLTQESGRCLALLPDRRPPRARELHPHPASLHFVCDGGIRLGKRQGRKEPKTEPAGCSRAAPPSPPSLLQARCAVGSNLTASLAAHGKSRLREPGCWRHGGSRNLQTEAPFPSSGFKESPPSHEDVRHVSVGGGEKQFSHLTSYSQQITEKKLPNLFSTRPERVSLRWGAGWGTLFWSVSESAARSGGWTEAAGVGAGRMGPQPQKLPFSNQGALPPPFPPGHAASRATLQLPRAETRIYFSKKKKVIQYSGWPLAYNMTCYWFCGWYRDILRLWQSLWARKMTTYIAASIEDSFQVPNR